MNEQQAKELLQRLERQSDTNQGLGWRLSAGVGGAGLGYALGSRNPTTGSGILGALLGGVGGYGSAYLAQLALKKVQAKEKLRRKTLYAILGSLSGAGAGFAGGLIRKDGETSSKPAIPTLIGAGLGGLAGFGYGAAADDIEDNFLHGDTTGGTAGDGVVKTV
jgi:hypothetical protein